jgi:cytidine deaminase
VTASSGGEALRAAAFTAKAYAYAPYSHFPVGAAVLTDQGTVVSGCNVENASYPLGLCAEQAAVAAAVAQGSRRFLELAIATDASDPTPPCGACRQFLAEFGDLPITSYTSGGGTAHWTLSELIPHPFSSAALPHGEERK